MSLLPLVLLTAACAPQVSGGVRPILDGPDFFDRPFPSDARLLDGHPDVRDFPGAGDSLMVDAYLGAAATIDGFGTNSPIYVRFAQPIDPSLLPSPAASMGLDSPVLLLDVDRRSPHRGERIPVAFEWTADETAFQPDNFLAIAPIFGFPLRPHTTYALVLRPPLVAATPADQPGAQTWGIGGDPDLLTVEETLEGLGLSTADVSLAVPFTTQDPLAETARIARAIQAEIGIPSIDQELTLIEDRLTYTLYTGEVAVPVWQQGERPYRSEGGAFAFGTDGTPIIAFWERVRFGLSVPHGTEPEGGWPTVLYSHGTGGDCFTFAYSGADDEEATVLGREGIAVIGISQPLHADRATLDTNAELDSFNYNNPYAGRTNFRQGALDQVYLAEVLTGAQATFTLAGESVRLDPDSLSFFGHSQGGLVGAIATPFLGDRVRAAGFSGTGGGLSMTLVLRKDPVDIAFLLGALLEFDDSETLTTFHPVAGLVQMLSEATDPLNYAPWWFAEAPPWAGTPVSVLLTEGLEDVLTPSITTEALSAAGRVPIVGDAVTAPDGLALRGLNTFELPTEENALGWSGAPLTAGLAQFEDDGHYAIYYNADARGLYRDFLASSLRGGARLED